jgi:Flp pilus assembly protein TadG
MTAVFRSPRKNSKTRFCYEAVYRHRPADETVAMLEHVRDFVAPARRFARAETAAAAVEFALVAAPFLALLFAILETALVFFASQTLEAAASNSARLIMTGQAQMAGYSQADFKTAVCKSLSNSMFNCSTGVYVDVKSYSSFTSIDASSPVANGKLDTSKMTYTPGGPGDIVVVRLYYQWPVYVTMFGDNLTNLNGGNRLMVATSVFRNEPYGG